MLIIPVKKLRPFAQMPVRATKGAAAFDLRVTQAELLENVFISYGSGLAFEFPEGVYGLLLARSSCYKRDHLLANGAGLIDSDYRGEVKGVFAVNSDRKFYFPQERFAQLLIQIHPSHMHLYMGQEIEFKEVQELSDTERGVGGFGSTGN